MNERKRAREDLEPLAGSSHPPFITYLALLLLGDVDELDKTPDRAAAHYRDALALFPASEAPFIALSRLSDERGDASGARDWLERSFALSTNRRVDPWGAGLRPVRRHRRPAVFVAGANPEMLASSWPSCSRCRSSPQQPTFRAGTEMVRIDTLVERDGKPVTGLTADDFTVLDNGAPQRIVTIRQMEAVAVGVALDTSGSMEGDRFARAQAATLALLGQLRPDESSVVIGFADLTARLIPAGTPPADRERLLDSVVSAGSTALADGAMPPSSPATPAPESKLLVVLTDGRNNSGLARRPRRDRRRATS